MSRPGPERLSFRTVLYETEGGKRVLTIARINSKLLDQYKGQTVRLTGKILQVNGDTATLEAADGGQVSVQRNLEHGSRFDYFMKCLNASVI